MLKQWDSNSSIEFKSDPNGFVHTVFIETTSYISSDGNIINAISHRTPVAPSSSVAMDAVAMAILSSDIDLNEFIKILTSMSANFAKPERFVNKDLPM